jgi:8-hydroxy-5-deazaflavin:NADPH oxidoreductase
MNIGIIGAGNMGSALGKIWAQKGHKLMFSYSRDPAKLEKIAQSIGSNAHVGTPTEAVQFADVVLLSHCRFARVTRIANRKERKSMIND